VSLDGAFLRTGSFFPGAASADAVPRSLFSRATGLGVTPGMASRVKDSAFPFLLFGDGKLAAF